MGVALFVQLALGGQTVSDKACAGVRLSFYTHEGGSENEAYVIGSNIDHR